MSLESFQRPDYQGWRNSLGWRTRRLAHHRPIWTVQRWNGEHWVEIDVVESYAEAREVPDRWRREYVSAGIPFDGAAG